MPPTSSGDPDARPTAQRHLHSQGERQSTSGFPSPADDAGEARLDVQRLVVLRPAATYFLRMRGEAMLRAGIAHGDILVVDRALRPLARRFIVLALGGVLVVRRFVRAVESHGVIFVEAGDGVSEAVALGAVEDDPSDPANALLWGVVTYIIHPADSLSPLPEGWGCLRGSLTGGLVQADVVGAADLSGLPPGALTLRDVT